MALEDDEIVALVTSDDAPDLVDEVDTNEQVQHEHSLTECVHALECNGPCLQMVLSLLSSRTRLSAFATASSSIPASPSS